MSQVNTFITAEFFGLIHQLIAGGVEPDAATLSVRSRNCRAMCLYLYHPTCKQQMGRKEK